MAPQEHRLTPNDMEFPYTQSSEQMKSVIESVVIPDETEYHAAFLAIGGLKLARFLKDHALRNKLGVGAGFALAGTFWLGAFGADITTKNEINDATTKATLLNWDTSTNVNIADLTFKTEPAAELKTEIGIEYRVFGKDIASDKWLTDPETDLSAEVVAVSNLELPVSAITQKTQGDKLKLTADMSQGIARTYVEYANLDVDADAEAYFYDTIDLMRDGLVKFTPLDQDQMPKPKVFFEDVKDNAKTQLVNQSIDAAMSTCPPLLQEELDQSTQDALRKFAVAFSDYEEKDVVVKPINMDKFQWTWKSETAQKVGDEHFKFEPKIESFEFEESTCTDAELKVNGETAEE